MYQLDPAVIRPGCSLEEDVAHRKRTGSLAEDPQQYCAELLARLAEGKTIIRSLRTADGRVMQVVHRPILGGGWVSTHEDVTKHRLAETALRENEHVLRSTFDHMTEGISIVDAKLVIVAANHRFRELLNLPVELCRAGALWVDVLRHMARRGDFGTGDAEALALARLESARRAELRLVERELRDGTLLEIRATQLPDGGFVTICTDVTARAKAASELRAAHTRLRDALDVVPEGLALFDADGRYVLWNRRYEETYAESVDHIRVGAKFEDVLRAGLDRGQYREAIGREEAWLDERMARLAKVSSTHEQHLPGDRWVRIEERRTADGGSIGVRIDITELKRREETFKLLFDGNPVPMLVYDTETLQFLAVNDAALDYYGYDREQFLSMTLLGVVPPEDRDRMAQLVKGFEPNRRAQASRHVRSGGSIVKVDVYSRTLTFGSRPARFAAVVDVTDRERVEEERARSRAFLEQVIDNVPLSITVKDASELRFVMLNRTAEQYWGVPRSEAIGKTVSDIFGSERAELVTARDTAALEADGPIYIGEHRRVGRGDEDRIYASRRVAVRGDDGKPLYVVGVMEDITDRKAVEGQLQQAQKMEAVGNLTGGIAHDFNNLLTVIIGNLDLLRSDLAGDPAAEPKVEAILQEALRAAELTQQLLAFSRRQPLRPRRVDVNRLISGTTRMLTRTLGAAIRMEVRTSPEAWPVLVDEPQLESALVNLAINARDAMPKGGILTFETQQLHLRAVEAAAEGLAPGDYTVIVVRDTGSGMPREVVAKIFEPFFTTKGPGQGTGLGLSMVYGFVKQSGGHVKVDSEVGSGTTFSLYLPRDTGAEAGIVTVSEDHAADQAILFANGETILAVDDNLAVRTTVVAQLRALGYYVIEADGGSAALKALDGPQPIDLLFTDVVMPGGLQGPELAARAREMRPGLKVLFTSGFPGTEPSAAVTLEEGDELLSKPYRRKDLAKAVHRILESA
jgi:PAS domain S-box-containing protein